MIFSFNLILKIKKKEDIWEGGVSDSSYNKNGLLHYNKKKNLNEGHLGKRWVSGSSPN